MKKIQLAVSVSFLLIFVFLFLNLISVPLVSGNVTCGALWCVCKCKDFGGQCECESGGGIWCACSCDNGTGDICLHLPI